MKKNETIIVAKGAIAAVLEEIGYDVSEIDGYIYGISKNEDAPDLLIYATGRKLSEKNEIESSSTLVSQGAIDKLKIRAEKRAGNVVPCLAYVVCKWSYYDYEVMIAPVDAMEAYAVKGGVYAQTDKGLWYNFKKAGDSVPPEAIARVVFTGKNM